jgi:hypothetical protein
LDAILLALLSRETEPSPALLELIELDFHFTLESFLILDVSLETPDVVFFVEIAGGQTIDITGDSVIFSGQVGVKSLLLKFFCLDEFGSLIKLAFFTVQLFGNRFDLIYIDADIAD